MTQTKALVRDLMIGNVLTVFHDETVREAAKKMAKHRVGALIVRNHQDQPVGIFTERDLLIKVVAEDLSLETLIRDVMTADLVCAQLHDTIDSLPEMMIQGGFRHVPVMDGFEPVGIVSMRDLLAHYRPSPGNS